MIVIALSACLALQTAIEAPKPSESRPAAVDASPKDTPKELSAAVVERLERMSQMSSEERAVALADLPPAQRERIEKGLQRLDALTPEQREQWFNRYRVFYQLPQKQKDAVRNVVKEFMALPQPRRKAVRQELETYKHMPMWSREARMRSADFKNRFTAEEREIIHRSAILLREPVAQTAKK